MKLLLTAIVIAFGIVATAVFAGPSGTARVPILLELFTSEGCSSCPPADQVLESLDRQPVANADLIVLSEHVDYWNHLGWSDPYSSPLFTDRQRKYSERLAATVYTPQLVIDGQFQMVGGDQQEVIRAISRASQTPKLALSLTAKRSGNTANVHVDAESGAAKADLYIAIAADHATSKVLKGENGGHVLTHVAVAQSIIKIGKWEESGGTGRDISILPKQLPTSFATAPTGGTRVIAILQDPQSGRILAAAQTKI